MNITQVKITPLDSGNTKAFASITIDNEFVVTGLRIINGRNGLFVSMPSRKNSKPDDGTEQYKAYIDTSYPITKESRDQIMELVLAKYYDTEINGDKKEFTSPEAKQVYEDTKNHAKIEVTEDDLPF